MTLYIHNFRARMLFHKTTAAIAYAIAISCLLFFDAEGALLTPVAQVFVGCSKWHFDCMGVPAECISHEQVCDGRRDCANGDDESVDICSEFFLSAKVKR